MKSWFRSKSKKQTQRPPPAYEYQPLASELSIRILGIHPSTNLSDPIHTSLIECTLQPGIERTESDDATFNPPYEALSYVWGAVHGDRPIQCDDKTLKVTPSCESALRHLRWPKMVRLVWVDAICINQSDNVEKSKQVVKMNDIYRMAGGVVIWLGEGDEQTSEWLKYLRHWYFVSLDLQKLPAWNSVEEVLREKKWPTKEADLEKFGTVQDGYACKALGNPYFRRIWTIQEAALATAPTVVCGNASLSWSYFSYGAQQFLHKGPDGMSGYSRRIDKDAIAFESYYKCCVIAHSSMRSTVWNPQYDTLSSVRTLIQTADANLASDPRDKVFGLYHLFLSLDIRLPTPDYTRGMVDIYREATAAIIKQTKSLTILDLTISDPGSELPSWVHDFRKVTNKYDGPSFRATGDSTVNSDVIGTEALSALPVQGLRFATIIHAGVGLKSTPEQPEDTPEAWAKLGARRVGEFMELMRISVEYTREPYDWAAEIPFEQFFNTFKSIIGSERPITMVKFLEMMKDWNTIAAELMKEASPPSWLPKRMPPGADWKLFSQDGNAIRWLLLSGMTDLEQFILEAVWSHVGQRMFIMNNGMFGIGPSSLQEGDLVVLLTGATMPMAIRPDNDAFRYIGSLTIDGIMNGEAWPEAEFMETFVLA